MKKVKSFLSVTLIFALIFALVGCSGVSSDSTQETTDTAAETTIETNTEEIIEELSTEDILDKAVDYFGKYIPLVNCDIDDTTYGNTQIGINVNGVYATNLSFSVDIENNVSLTLLQSTSELSNKGFSEFEKQERSSIYLYNGKALRISDYSLFGGSVGKITAISFETDEDSAEFEYSGLNGKSTFEEVVNCLGYPSKGCLISYDEENDEYLIPLCYRYEYDEDDVQADFYFIYDYKTDETKLREFSLFT